MKITEREETGYNLIELRLNLQRAIEILDDLDLKNNPLGDKRLNTLLKGLYMPLDKQTRKYNDMYSVSAEGTTVFYRTVCENAKITMSKHLLDKAKITQFLIADELNNKAVEGIIHKVLKVGNQNN